jgi:hypothetical protein
MVRGEGGAVMKKRYFVYIAALAGFIAGNAVRSSHGIKYWLIIATLDFITVGLGWRIELMKDRKGVR